MTDFNLDAVVAYADEASSPTGHFGCVHELWQQERNRLAHNLIAAQVPAHLLDAAEQALRVKGIIEDAQIEVDDTTCCHGLDPDTCPCGCFEG